MQFTLATVATMATSVLAACLPETKIAESGSLYSGDITFFNPALGACGMTHGDSDYVAAVSHLMFDAYTPGGNPNQNPLCGRTVVVRHNGKEVRATMVDRCTGCQHDDIDLSPAAYNAIAEPGAGRVKGTWEFV